MPRSGVPDERVVFNVEQLYKTHSGMVYRRCLRLLGDRERAAEAMQDVFLKVLKVEDRVRDHPSPAAFLYRVATHHALNLIRSSRRRPEIADSEYLALAADLRSEDHEPSDRLYVHELLENEQESTRLMIVYHFVDGMTLEELAEEFGMSISGIRKRLAKFKEQSQSQREKP